MILSKTVVGIDIETTSLDAKEGEIIEVAAIRFDIASGNEIARFEHLTSSQYPISELITGLTGISTDMLKGTKPFSAYAKGLKKFVGDDIIFAHNAPFDIGWLAEHGCPLDNPIWDTFPLATIAWPEAPTYNLGSLAGDLDIKIEGEHRAGQDIILTWELLKKIREQLNINSDQFSQIKHILQASDLYHYLELFRQAPNHKSDNGTTKTITTIASYPKSVNKILEKGGYLETHLPGFKHRPEQLQMAEHVAKWINSRSAALIEAGTGTGKTYGYLIPSLLKAKRILIATYTHTLQDQLVEKDIPELLNALGENKSVATLKGRRNYVCGTRLQQYINRSQLKPDEAWLLLKIILWLDHGGNGDLERLNFSHQGQHLAWLISADSITCRLQCQRDNPACPYVKARLNAATSDITVINHALLLQYSQQEEETLNYDVIIVDEAHHLEEAALSASQLDLSLERIGEIVANLSQISSNTKLKSECQSLLRDYKSLLASATHLINAHTQNNQIRITASIRSGSSWRTWSSQATSWLGRLRFIIGLIKPESANLKNDQLRIYRDTLQQAEQLSIEIQQFIIGDSERVQWIENYYNENLSHLKDSAVHVSPYIQPLLTLPSCLIMTSATLTTEGNFSFLKKRFGLEDIDAIQLSSSFDYSHQMSILVADTGPEPSSNRFDAHVSKLIEQVVIRTKGRLMALFTSQAALQNVYGKLIRPLNIAQINLYAQKMTGGRHNIANRFRDNACSVLLGTNSFWEGIDIPGESLSVIVIPKLPFPRLNDPIIESLSEKVGRSQAFQEIMLPRMIMRLRQGIGRLIRSQNDRGVIVLLDSRLTKQSYGQQVLHSLPPAPIQISSVEEIPDRLTKWFGKEVIEHWKSECE